METVLVAPVLAGKMDLEGLEEELEKRLDDFMRGAAEIETILTALRKLPEITKQQAQLEAETRQLEAETRQLKEAVKYLWAEEQSQN